MKNYRLRFFPNQKKIVANKRKQKNKKNISLISIRDVNRGKEKKITHLFYFTQK